MNDLIVCNIFNYKNVPRSDYSVEEFIMPDLLDLSIAEASAILKNNGIEYEFTGGKGTVVYQVPAAGSIVNKNIVAFFVEYCYYNKCSYPLDNPIKVSIQIPLFMNRYILCLRRIRFNLSEQKKSFPGSFFVFKFKISNLSKMIIFILYFWYN